ncbi:SNF2-related protein [Corchorus olitorius]|uniref:SNF2-related protein n=1 Tax=Corchorus olitorius TaxID=93759 RepID=A0A1R3HT52_9ROSI|nr:SNF2-related protein [Corchorus olitorius]
MESNSSKSGSSTKVDGASSSKVVSTTAKGSTSLSSAKTDSNCSRSSAKEIGINKVASPSHSSSGKKTSIGGSDTNDRFVSCFGKVSSSFRYEKVMLVSPQGDHGSCSINKKQVAVHEDKTSDRTRRDARRYKEWLKSTISKRKMSGNSKESSAKERCSVSDLSQLSFGGSPGEYDRYQNYVNKLLAHWHKCQNAVVYDDQADQERVMKVILFVLSLQSTTRRPSLIISKSTALSIWESEFIRVASSANIIFYNGSKDVRSSIRSLEFYNESGSIMFEILLSSYNIVAEDLDILKGIEWGAIIVDECQSSHMSRYFGQIKKLIADMRLLLVSGQIKECDADYQNMLSLLDSGYELGSDNLKKIDSYTNDYKLKDIFSQYIAFECKLRSSSFVEYWVPVQLSHLQLEQYCATLLSNSMFLSSSSKSDPVDVLRDVIISTRKCCDHPYLLDQSLESVVTKGLSAEEKLDVEIKASGKLELLDNILKETKARDLRSIGGSGRDSVGNILDDLICQRFDRACHPSIKLSAVDVVILFDSGLEPQNDIKALHRISIGSQFEEIKIFRLYSSFTVEEKILILAKEAADLLKHKVDKNESLAIAKLGLNLDCREEEVEDIYSELQSVAKEFAQCSENLEGYKKSNCSKKVCGDPRYTVQKNIPSSPNCSQSGTVHGASSKDPDESLVKKTVSSSSTRMVAGRFGSDTEHGGTGTDAIVSEEVRATCDNQQHKVSSSVVQPKYHALTSDSQELQSPLQSGTVHGASSKVPDEFLMEKTVSSSSTRKVAGHFGSGSEHGGTGTEAIGSEEVRATCNSEHGGTGTEAIGSEEARATCNSEHGGTGTEAIGSEEVRATCNSEHGGTGTEAIVSEEVRATCDNQQHKVSSSVVQPKHHALTSDSQELQSPIQPPATESATEPSEVPQVQCTAVVAGNDLMISTNATQPNEENDETDAVTSERETVSKMGHHDAAVTRLSGDSNSLEFPGTGHFLLEADINTVELNPLLCQETAVSSLLPARLSSAESNISAIPASGVQHDLSSNWHVLCQEAPVPRQASLEVLLDEPSNAPVRNSVTLLPQQPSSSTPMAESETCTENQRTTSTPLRLPNDLPCQVNTFGPISRLKSERDKEVEEICKKYDMLVRDAEMTFTKRRQDYESYCNMVYSNNVLAETLTFIFDKKAVQFAGFDSFIHLAQQPTVMLDPRIEPSLTSLGAPPPLHMFNHSPSAVVAPHFAPTVCVAESNQVCNVRAPAPHLRALNSPSMSIPPTSALHGRMPNQQIANNPPAISPNLHASALLGRMPNQQLANNLPAISPDPHLSPLQGRMPNQQLANDLPAISPDPYLSALQGRMPNQQLANNLPAISPDPYLSALQGSMPNQQQLAHNLPTISQDPHLSALQGRMSNQQLAHTQLRISPILPQGTSRLLPTETLGLHPVVAGKPVYDRYIPALELLANIGNHVSPDLQHHLRPHQNFGLPSYLPNLTDQIATDSLIVPTAAINAEPICLSDDD